MVELVRHERVRKWSGREDLNLRPLGLKPKGYAVRSNDCARFWAQGSTRVVIRDRHRPAFADHRRHVLAALK